VKRLDKLDMWDVARRLRPNITWDEFEEMWEGSPTVRAVEQRTQRLGPPQPIEPA
jgi:hypothetical protein